MKVHVRYCDGSYYAEPFTEAHTKAGMKGVEVDAGDWREYIDFLDTSAGWHKWLRDLDNQQYFLEHPEEAMTGE